MASIFLRDPTYIQVQEVKDSTSKTGLQALTDNEIKILIAKSEDAIDEYIVRPDWTLFEADQPLFFPESLNGASNIPDDITKACFYCVQQFFESGDLITGASSSTSGGEVKQERVGDRTVTYTEASSTSTTNNLKALGIPAEAESMLKKYRKVSYRVKL